MHDGKQPIIDIANKRGCITCRVKVKEVSVSNQIMRICLYFALFQVLFFNRRIFKFKCDGISIYFRFESFQFNLIVQIVQLLFQLIGQEYVACQTFLALIIRSFRTFVDFNGDKTCRYFFACLAVSNHHYSTNVCPCWNCDVLFTDELILIKIGVVTGYSEMHSLFNFIMELSFQRQNFK